MLAAVGVLLLTEPWAGASTWSASAFALAAAVCWAAYILLTQRVGDERRRAQALAVSMPVAGLVATVVAGPRAFGRLTPELLLVGSALAVLLPVVPFTLEMLALRRLTTAAFGTLMSLEPAIALLVGWSCCVRCPARWPWSASGSSSRPAIGAERTGARTPEVEPATPRSNASPWGDPRAFGRSIPPQERPECTGLPRCQRGEVALLGDAGGQPGGRGVRRPRLLDPPASSSRWARTACSRWCRRIAGRRSSGLDACPARRRAVDIGDGDSVVERDHRARARGRASMR